MLILALLISCSMSDPNVNNAPPGWGAVFWKEGRATRVSEGSVIIGRGGVFQASEAKGQGICNGTPLSGAPALTRVAVTPKGDPPELPPQSKVLASTVTQAAAQLHEALPEADRFTPHVDDPAHFYGMTLGTVAKTRRELAPPVLLASAWRDGNAVLAVLDREGNTTHSALIMQRWTERANLLPVADYDGDGARDVILYGPQDLGLYRLDESGQEPTLAPVHRWHCDEADGGPQPE